MTIADKDYFLNSDKELAATEEENAFLLIRAGQEISKDVADKYGIGKVTPTESEATADESVKAAKPSKNKAEKPAENKGAK